MQVEDRIAALEERTRALEAYVGFTPPRAETRVSTPPPPPRAKVSASVPRVSARDLEDVLGGRLLAWVGGLAVALGVIFLLAIAVSRGWIGEAERTILAGLFSGGLLTAGVWAHERRGRTQATKAAVAAGIAGQFATAVVAGSVYELVPPILAVLGALSVGVTATAIAVRWSAPGIAALGILGALASPALLGALDGPAGIVVLLIAAASATVVLVWQRWTWLSFAAHAIVTPQWLVFVFADARTDLGIVAVLVGFGALAVAAAVAYQLRAGTHEVGVASVLQLAINALVLGVAGAWTLGFPDEWLAALALAHLALGAAARAMDLPRDLSTAALGLGLIIGDIAIAQYLQGLWLETAWAASGVLLVGLARYATPGGEQTAALVAGAGQLVLALLHVLRDAPPVALVDGLAHPVTAGAALAIVTAAVVAASVAMPSGPWVIAARFAGAGLVLYTASVELVTAFADSPQQAQALLSGLWAVTGVATLLIGLVRDKPVLRHAALALLMLTVGKVFLYDLASLTSLSRVASFVALGLLLLAGAFAWERIRGDLGGKPASLR